MLGLNPFHYSLSQVQQAVIALVVGVISLVAFFIAFDPSFKEAAVVVVGQVFAVIAVFTAKEFSYDDLSKTIMALVGGVITVVGFLVPGGVSPDTVEVIVGIASQLLLVGGVLWANHAPANSAVGTAAPPGTLR